MAFTPSRGIKGSSFLKNLSLLIEERFQRVFISVEIIPLIDSYEFIQALISLESVSELSMSLVPSNPGYRDQWREIDEELHITQTKELSLKYQFAEGVKAKIPDGGLLDKFLSMIADGYGKARAKGVLGGVARRISSVDQFKTVDVSDELGSEDMINVVSNELQRLAAEQIPHEDT